MAPKPSSTSETDTPARVFDLDDAAFEPAVKERLSRLAVFLAGDERGQPGLAAAASLLSMHMDAATVEGALLSCVDADAVLGKLGLDASSEVLALLQGVTRLNAIAWDRLDDEAAEALRRMFLAMARDVRVVLIVLALRVERMRSRPLAVTPARERMAQDALDVFAPLANRLGIWHMKSELEDGAFEVLEPESYAQLAQLLEQGKEERSSFVAETLAVLREKLEAAGIEASVSGRAKHLYSIYKKMQRKQVDFAHIFDVSAVRVITGEVADCYAALGVVHSMWKPIKGEFDDYIAMPKGNGYQSLHTAVVGQRGRPVEVQMRTRTMHQFAEYGVAAHWAYKEQRGVAAQDRFTVLRRLLDWERELEDPKQFVESLRTDIFEDQVLVFTPAGDVIDLPKGATPLDFAYRIHTMVGHRTRGARINGQIASLEQDLQTGDRVEILTHRFPQPSRDWMNPTLGYVKTASARSKVRHWFREQGRDAAVAAGKALLEKELSRMELGRVQLQALAESLGAASVEELQAAVGYGDRSVHSVVAAAANLEHPRTEEPEVPSSPAPASMRGTSGVVLDGVRDVMGKRARCCNPLPGDSVLGFVTRGRGIVIHKRDCDNVRQSPEPERWVEIDWGPGSLEVHSVQVEVLAQPSPDLLSRVVRLLTHLGVSVSAATTQPYRDQGARLLLTLRARDSAQLTSALQRVTASAGVEDARVVAR